MKQFRNLEIYTDGGCHVHKDDKAGAFALAVFTAEGEKVLELQSEIELDTTNNVQELKAVIRALGLVRSGSWRMCTIYTDSQYVQKGLTEWMPNWKANKWKTSTGKPVKNVELWKQLNSLYNKGGKVEIEWVKAHSTNEKNNLVDALCTETINNYYENKQG